MGKLKGFYDTWRGMSWMEKFPVYCMWLAIALYGLYTYANHVYKEELRDAGFTNVTVESSTAYASNPAGLKPCRIALEREADWWYLKNPTNDGVPIRLASEVFKRQHVQAYCADKQPQSP